MRLPIGIRWQLNFLLPFSNRGKSPPKHIVHPMCFGGCMLFASLPACIGIYSDGCIAVQLHRSLTFPPSLWPDRELRKYHYPSALVVALPVATRSLLQQSDRSALCVVADLQTGLEVLHLIAQGMYLSGLYSVVKAL